MCLDATRVQVLLLTLIEDCMLVFLKAHAVAELGRISQLMVVAFQSRIDVA